VNVTLDAVSKAASPDCSPRADCAAQQTQSHASPQVQTPVSQHWQPATQSHAQFTHTRHEPPEQQPPAAFAVAVLPPDTNPNADTPVSARNVKSLDMMKDLSQSAGFIAATTCERRAAASSGTKRRTPVDESRRACRDSANDHVSQVQYRICSGGWGTRPESAPLIRIGASSGIAAGTMGHAAATNRSLGCHNSTGETGITGTGRDVSHFGQP